MPKDASVICDIDKFAWKDEAWINARKNTNNDDKPMSIYEVQLGSFDSAIENVNDNNAIKAYISNGYLIVKASEDIARIEVYELNGIGIASLSPMSMNAYLDLTNTDTDVYVATITLRSGKTMIIKLIRQ